MPTEVSIVAGGWSFREMVDHRKLRGTVVAVNDAAIYLKRKPDVVVSMDRLWTMHRWPDVHKMNVPFWARVEALRNVEMWTREPQINPFDCDYTTCVPSSLPRQINGTNSGACAMNLVLKWRPVLVWLYGFDMRRDCNGNPYWYPPYTWANPKGGTKERKYGKWAEQLSPVIAAYWKSAIGLVQVGPQATLPGVHCIPYSRLEELANDEQARSLAARGG